VEQALDFAPAADAARVVNAALALHHVPAGSDLPGAEAGARDGVLRAIAALAPTLLTLTEPDAGHTELDFAARAAEAWRHYGLVFGALDGLCARTLPARATLEAAFFGREVMNVVGAEGPARCERHDRIEGWEARLRRAGFVPARGAHAGDGAIPDGVAGARLGTARVAGGTALTVAGEPLLAATAWRLGRAG
jgi:hypothetical protein